MASGGRAVSCSIPFHCQGVFLLLVIYFTKTRSGRIFSPFLPEEDVISIVTEVDLDELVLRAVEVERKRETSGVDDADDVVLEYLESAFAVCTLSKAPPQPPPTPVASSSSSSASTSTFLVDTGAKRGRPRARTSHSKKMKTQARAAARRNLQAKGVYQHRVSSPTRRKLSKPFTFQSFIDSRTLSAAQGAWIGKNIANDKLVPPNRREPYTLAECMEYGFGLIKWDGMLVNLQICPSK